ncbi:hypothetical protein SERLA73DRAFT_115213, partial [Serpula lacrymans var. lacrymans S7.3]
STCFTCNLYSSSPLNHSTASIFLESIHSDGGQNIPASVHDSHKYHTRLTAYKCGIYPDLSPWQLTATNQLQIAIWSQAVVPLSACHGHVGSTSAFSDY